jgi:hypothetical protein
VQAGWLVYEKCAFEEYDQNRDAADAGRPLANMAQIDPDYQA